MSASVFLVALTYNGLLKLIVAVLFLNDLLLTSCMLQKVVLLSCFLVLYLPVCFQAKREGRRLEQQKDEQRVPLWTLRTPDESAEFWDAEFKFHKEQERREEGGS